MSDFPSRVTDSTLSNTLQALSRALLALGPESGFPPDPRLADLITALPRLTESDIDIDGVCPICLVSFRAHLAEEEMASVMESPTHAPEDLGVTRLENTCKHIFCRKDISTWIRQARNSCPTCRRPLLPDLPATSTSTDPPAATSTLPSSESPSNSTSHPNAASTIIGDNINANTSAGTTTATNSNEGPDVQDNAETAAARLVNDVIREVLDRLSLSPSGSGLTNTDLHVLLESVLPTLIPPVSQTESSDVLDLEGDHEYPGRSEFNGMYS